MTINEKFNELNFNNSKEFNSYKLVDKYESKLCKFLNIITFGRFKYVSAFAFGFPGVGYRIYLPKYLWETPRGYALIRHETVHLRQHKRFTRILFLLMYLFPPTILTFRAKFELEAYKEQLHAYNDLNQWYGLNYNLHKLCHEFTDLFCNSTYVWMFPFRKYIYTKLRDVIYLLEGIH